jgi:hypothetical protein
MQMQIKLKNEWVIGGLFVGDFQSATCIFIFFAREAP